MLSCRSSTRSTTPELPSSSMDRSSALLPLKTPHACHPEQDSTDGRLLLVAKEKGSCAGGVEVSVTNERAEEKGGKILTLQNLKSPNQVLTRLLREVWPLMPPGWAPRQPGSSPQCALMKKQTIQKNSFLRRPGVQDPASVLPTMRVLLPSAWWVPTAH